MLDFIQCLHFENTSIIWLFRAGLERKSKIPDAECNKNTAFHEAGHALVAYYTKDAAKIHKVTILARGPSLGHVSVLVMIQ